MRRALEHAVKVIDPWIEYKRSLARVPAVSAGIVYRDEIIFSKGYGYADLAKRTPATDITCYRIASISKTFTAIAVMQLVDRGLLQLDDKVQKFLPWFRSKKDPGLAKITLRHLLTHMAGIERDGNTSHWETGRFPTIAHIRDHVSEGIVIFRPLETFKYSNLGYTILGQVIAAVSGQPYARYVEEQIIRRLGLTHTSPTLNAAVRKRLAVGYGRDLPPRLRPALPHSETHAMDSATGLTSNVVDLCRYMRAQSLGNPDLISDDGKREMQRIHWLNKKADRHYGLGYDIWKVDQTVIVGHGGGFPGFMTRIGMDPESKIGVAVLTNALDDLAGILIAGIFSTIAYFAKNASRFQPSRKRSRRLARYEGRFSSRWSDADVVRIGTRLVAFGPMSDKPMEEGSILAHVGGHEFKIDTGSEFGYLGEKVTFQFDRNRRLTGLSWGPNPMKAAGAGLRPRP